MPDLTHEIVAWIAILLLAIPYTMWAKHSRTKPLAAYLIFITIVSVAGWIVYSFASIILAGLLDPTSFAYRAIQLTIFGLSLIIGIIIGHWQVRKPPRESPPI